MYKMYNGLSGIQLQIMFESVVDSRTRGRSLELKKHRSHLDLRKCFFSERVVTCKPMQ